MSLITSTLTCCNFFSQSEKPTRESNTKQTLINSSDHECTKLKRYRVITCSIPTTIMMEKRRMVMTSSRYLSINFSAFTALPPREPFPWGGRISWPLPPFSHSTVPLILWRNLFKIFLEIHYFFVKVFAYFRQICVIYRL